MNKIKKKKIYRIIISIILLLLIVIYLLIKIINKYNDKLYVASKATFNYEEYSKNTKEYLNNKVIPQNIYDFFHDYSGNISRNDLYEKLYIVSQFLPQICSEELYINNPQVFYYNYSEKIKQNLGIENETDFLKFWNIINNYKIANHELDYCSYHSKSMENEGKYSTFSIDFKYKKCEVITLNFGLLNEYDSDYSIIKIVLD